MSENNFDLNLISSECSISDESNPKAVIRKIGELKGKFDEERLVWIYNHFLTKTRNSEVLNHLLKRVEKVLDKSSLNVLLDILVNKTYEDKFRIACAKVIGKYKDSSAVPALLHCLNEKDENYRVRLVCADVLGKIGDPYAVSPLINVVQDEDEKSVYVRESAAAALGYLGDTRAVDPLVSILETKKGIMDKFTFLKERVIESLGKLNLDSDRVFKALENSLMDESAHVRINAIEALMESEDERAYEKIKEMLQDGDNEVKKNALIALYNMVGREILDEVLKSPAYNDYLKDEAQELIDEYETGDEIYE